MLRCISQMTKLLMMTRGMNVGYETSQAFVTSSSPFCNSSCKFVDRPRNVKSTNFDRHIGQLFCDSFLFILLEEMIIPRNSVQLLFFSHSQLSFTLSSHHLLCHKTKLLFSREASSTQEILRNSWFEHLFVFYCNILVLILVEYIPNTRQEMMFVRQDLPHFQLWLCIYIHVYR